MNLEGFNAWERTIYKAGYETRQLGLRARACPYDRTQLREFCLWMGGYNDAELVILREIRPVDFTQGV